MFAKLVIISGIDGSGKSSNINIITEKFLQRKLKIINIWTRGGYSPGFLFLKSLFRFIFGNKLLPSGYSKKRKQILKKNFISKFWINLAIIDLIIFWCIYLRVKMLFEDIIICDRYLLDTLIDFKINFRNINLEGNLFWKILNFLIPKPDLSLMLIIPFEESQKRLLEKFEPFPDNYEDAISRYKLYTKYVKSFNYKNINASNDLEIVSKKVYSQIYELLSFKL